VWSLANKGDVIIFSFHFILESSLFSGSERGKEKMERIAQNSEGLVVWRLQLPTKGMDLNSFCEHAPFFVALFA